MDDEHGVGEEPEILEFIRLLGGKVTLKWPGPHRFSHSPRYSHLNRERVLLASGTVIRPNGKYIEGILRILSLEGCRPMGRHSSTSV